MPHFVGNPGPNDRVGQRRPYEVPIHVERGTAQSERQGFRQGPEDEDEAENGGHRPEKAGHERQSTGGEQVDIFRNTLIRVIGTAAGKHFHPVKHLVGCPPGKIFLRHPPPPPEGQSLLQVIGIHGKGNVTEGQGREPHETMVYRFLVIILEGTVELIEPVVQKQRHVHRRNRKDDDSEKIEKRTLPLTALPVFRSEPIQPLHRLPVPMSCGHGLPSCMKDVFIILRGGKGCDCRRKGMGLVG